MPVLWSWFPHPGWTVGKSLVLSLVYLLPPRRAPTQRRKTERDNALLSRGRRTMLEALHSVTATGAGPYSGAGEGRGSESTPEPLITLLAHGEEGWGCLRCWHRSGPPQLCLLTSTVACEKGASMNSWCHGAPSPGHLVQVPIPAASLAVCMDSCECQSDISPQGAQMSGQAF